MTPGAPDPAETFRQEAQDLLIQLEDVLLDLDGNPGDRELIDTAFRALHTLKGSGAMFGFDDLARFAHTVENTFDRLRRTGAEPSRELIAVTLAAKDFMRQLIQSPGEAEAAIGDGLVQELLRHGPAASLAETGGPCGAAPPAGRAEGGSHRLRHRLRAAPGRPAARHQPAAAAG